MLPLNDRARTILGKFFIAAGLTLGLIAIFLNTPVDTPQLHSDRGYVLKIKPAGPDNAVLATVAAEDGHFVEWRMSTSTKVGDRVAYFEADDGRMSQFSFPGTYPYRGYVMGVLFFCIVAIIGGFILLPGRIRR